jgi:hypothetical protein
VSSDPGAERVGVHGPALDPKLLVEISLIWAAGHGRRNIVEYLLDRKPDPTVVEPVFNSTALGAARYQHQVDVVSVLERAAGR